MAKYRRFRARVFVYVLIDPRSGLPMYVGSSIDPLRRCRQHRNGDDLDVRNWVRELRSLDMWPRIQIVGGHRRVEIAQSMEARFIFALNAKYGTLLNKSKKLPKRYSDSWAEFIISRCCAIFEGQADLLSV